MLPPLRSAVRRLVPWLGWGLLIWVVLFWRLGYPSFWDPDEAHYAQASREMLASGSWLVPMYNGQPFFDKPILFYWLQMASFSVFGPTEFAARLVSALSALGLLVSVRWLGARFFTPRVGSLAVLLLALLPGTFALSAYAILDMTFTAFLFGGLSCLAVAALRDRPRLQYAGYALIALAVLTKGPLALALAGLAFLIALIIAPAARRPLRELRWMSGLAAILVVSAPWFIYMWWRYRGAFIDFYVFHENISLYARPVFGPRASTTYFLPIVAAGLLPWTPVLIGRLVDIARTRRWSSEERLLWAWNAAVLGFFSLSHFKLDHYVYPMAPALCLLVAHAWHEVRDAESIRNHAGAAIGLAASAVMLVVAAAALVPLVRDLPSDLSPWVQFVPLLLALAGVLFGVRLIVGRFRPPAVPIAIAGSLLMAYSILLLIVVPEIERAKPVKSLARWVAATVPHNGAVGAYRMDRWNTSWRFYVERKVHQMESPEQLLEFLRQPGPHYCVMMRTDFEALSAAGYPLVIVQERVGLSNTSGRAIQRKGRKNWKRFVVVTSVVRPST